MSRDRKAKTLVTREKQVKFGEKILIGNEPAALVGPNNNKDTLTLKEFCEQLYGNGYQCVLIPPEGKQ